MPKGYRSKLTPLRRDFLYILCCDTLFRKSGWWSALPNIRRLFKQWLMVWTWLCLRGLAVWGSSRHALILMKGPWDIGSRDLCDIGSKWHFRAPKHLARAVHQMLVYVYMLLWYSLYFEECQNITELLSLSLLSSNFLAAIDAILTYFSICERSTRGSFRYGDFLFLTVLYGRSAIFAGSFLAYILLRLDSHERKVMVVYFKVELFALFRGWKIIRSARNDFEFYWRKITYAYVFRKWPSTKQLAQLVPVKNNRKIKWLRQECENFVLKIGISWKFSCRDDKSEALENVILISAKVMDMSRTVPGTYRNDIPISWMIIWLW